MSEWPGSVGIVGCGAMGRAVAAGLAAGHAGLGQAMVLADPIPDAAEGAAGETGGRTGSAAEAGACDVVVLAVKPRDVDAALRAVTPSRRPGTLALSVVAGRSLDQLAAAGFGEPAVRLMPNLAVRHGAGVVAVAPRGLDVPRRDAVERLLRPLGAIVELEESLFGAATALVGSGPGILALVAEGLEEGAVGAGITRESARAMVTGVLAGTAALLADGADPAALRQMVTSPGGTTAAAVRALERGAVRAHVADAISAAAGHTSAS